MGKSIVEMAAEIVKSQCRANSMSTKEINYALVETYKTLQSLSGGLIEKGSSSGSEQGESSSGVAEEKTSSEEKAPPEVRSRGKKKKESEQKTTKINIPSQDSIQQDQVICLECGKSFKVLSGRHLQKHGLSSREYKKKHGFALGQPLCSKNVSEKRKKAGEKRGAPENLLKAIEAKKKTGETKK